MGSRRELLTVLGACVLCAPFGSFAQRQAKVARVGVLLAGTQQTSLGSVFRQGMRELGYVEGKNLVTEWRFAEGKFDRLPELAAELVQLRVDVIVAISTPATRAAQKATATIPIVMVNIADPVEAGFAKTLARPGGNITGTASITSELGGKHLEMLLNMAPKLSRLAVLVNSGNEANTGYLKSIQAVTPQTGVTILAIDVQTAAALEHAFARITKQNARAVIVAPDPLFTEHRRLIAQLAIKHRLPSIYAFGQYPQAGGLMSYGNPLEHQFRRAPIYVDKILKGAKPSDLPVEQPMTFELVINKTTAKALGLTIPQALLISAEKLID